MRRKRWKALLVFAAIAWILLGCRHDNFNEGSGYSNSGKFHLVTSRISLKESKHLQQLLPALAESKSVLNKELRKTAAAKSMSFGDSITINTDDVVYIENGPNYHTYTFNIMRNSAANSSLVENLVLTPLPDGSYKEIITSYNFTSEEKQNIIDGFGVSTKGKVTIKELSNAPFNTGGQLTSKTVVASTCSLQEETVWQGCSQHNPDGTSVHNQGNVGSWGSCTASVKPRVYTIMVVVCTDVYDDGSTYTYNSGAGEADPLNPGNPESGNPPIIPCTEPSVYTVPTDPSQPTDLNGCPTGIPTVPNLSTALQTPCEKTKEMLQKPQMQPIIDDLKNQANNLSGEKGYKIMKDGSPAQQTTDNSDHSVNIGDPSLVNGAYHNHSGLTVDMFSATDISTMLEISRYQGVGNFGNAFLGLLACNDSHYVIRFKGSLASELPTQPFSEGQLVVWNDAQVKYRDYLLNDPAYFSVQNGQKNLNSKGLEKIFFQTLKLMNMEGKVELQKIDSNNNVSIINQNLDGSIADPIPCS